MQHDAQFYLHVVILLVLSFILLRCILYLVQLLTYLFVNNFKLLLYFQINYPYVLVLDYQSLIDILKINIKRVVKLLVQLTNTINSSFAFLRKRKQNISTAGIFILIEGGCK